jgi:membrane-bound ClpP family serine protease
LTSEELLMWGLGLLAASLLLIIIEVFVPSGGLISIVAAGCGVTGLIFLYRYSTAWGVSGTVAMFILGPMAFGFALKVWPSTPIGRKMLGEKEPEEKEADRLAELAERERMLSLIGAQGTVVTDLRPVGLAMFDGKRTEVLSESGIVRAGATVRITSIDSNQIKVRAV